MIVEFWERTPGQHRLLLEANLPAVPRVGESVSLNGRTWQTVHSVLHILTVLADRADGASMASRVYLNP